jgi:hypothetical protein
MVPDTTLRLQAALKTLDDVITPLIPAQAAFAQEQLALIKRSIALVCTQIPHEYAFIIRDAQGCMELGRALAALLPSGDRCRIALQDAIGQATTITPAEIPDRPAIESVLRGLKQTLENAVDALAASPDPDVRARTTRLVLEHSEQQTIRERVWVLATGFDPDPAGLPSIDSAIYGRGTKAEAV